jgi:hypothetical protein
MATYYPKHSGLGNSAAYQVSGKPYATASIVVPQLGTAPMEIPFPSVTKFVTIVNTKTGTNVPLRFGFSASDHYFVLDNGESYTGEWRVSKVFLLADEKGTDAQASIVAGVTSVPFGDLETNWSGSVGVG